METVNKLTYEEFIDKFGNVVEHCPIIAAAVWSARPFASSADLFEKFTSIIDLLSMTCECLNHGQLNQLEPL